MVLLSPLSSWPPAQSSSPGSAPSSVDSCRTWQSCSLKMKRWRSEMTAGSVPSTNDGDGESHHQHARDGAHPAHHLAQGGDGGDVAIPDSRHGDQSPPVGVKHGVELCSRGAVLLKHKRQRGEDQDLRDVTLLERHLSSLLTPMVRKRMSKPSSL